MNVMTEPLSRKRLINRCDRKLLETPRCSFSGTSLSARYGGWMQRRQTWQGLMMQQRAAAAATALDKPCIPQVPGVIESQTVQSFSSDSIMIMTLCSRRSTGQTRTVRTRPEAVLYRGILNRNYFASLYCNIKIIFSSAHLVFSYARCNCDTCVCTPPHWFEVSFLTLHNDCYAGAEEDPGLVWRKGNRDLCSACREPNPTFMN